MVATELKTGRIFQENEAPFQVLKYEHIKSARGGANVKVKARNLITGSVLEKSYLATAKIDDAFVNKENAQYLYNGGTGFIFMNPTTFEQFTIPTKVLGEATKFLKEGEKVQVMYFDGKPITVELPKTMIFEIEYTEPGHKGNTVTNTFKDATLDKGTVVKVPTFIKIGDKVKVNTVSGEYNSKA
mgnify:FL=1